MNGRKLSNELEIANDNPEFIDKYGKILYALFRGMRRYLSSKATMSVCSLLVMLDK
tara:strand:+ start:10438 stop:10605 length:168 start_codon:yes stop_codon:yes gene_type:complete